MNLECQTCGSDKQLTYTFHQRGDLICEKCRSKVSESQRGKFSNPDKAKQQWEKFAKEKNSSIAKKYNYGGNRIHA